MNSKTLGNIALSRATTHFAQIGHFIFTPFGDNSGAIDLIVSHDGKQLFRVQCKYATGRHDSIYNRYGKTVYRCPLRVWTKNNSTGHTNQKIYGSDDFDILFIATPDRDWLIDWPSLCRNGKDHRTTVGPPKIITLGNRMKPFEWVPPVVTHPNKSATVTG